MKANAFRVLRKEFVDYYKTGDLSQLPNLEGFYFNRERTVNTYTYDPNIKYLHFFDCYASAKSYLEETHFDHQDEYCICEFWFPEELLNQTKFQGKYFSKIEMRDVFRDEYIFPINFYTKDNFIKISSPDDYSKQYNYDPDNYSDYNFGNLFGK